MAGYAYHGLQHLAQLEEGGGDAGGNLEPLLSDLPDVLLQAAAARLHVLQQFLQHWQEVRLQQINCCL